MGDLLSKAEYAAIAKSISLPSNAFINGAFKPSLSGKRSLQPIRQRVSF